MDSRTVRPPAALIGGAVGRRRVSTRAPAPSPSTHEHTRRDRSTKLSPGPFVEGENRLYLADNLRVLGALARELGPVFALAYLDPPFNTGRTFDEYDDTRSREAWLAMMEPRVEQARDLLRDDGALVAEIDDTELGPLQCLLDRVLGAKNRVATITVVRSAATGHKASNVGPVNVADYLLVYAKSRASFRPTPLYRRRAGIDGAYRSFLENPDAAPEHYRFSPLAAVVAHEHGYPSARAARTALGAEWDVRVATFAERNARQVVRFAQVRVEAVSKAARMLVARSKASPEKVYRLERPGLPDLVLKGGNRMLTLAQKLRSLDAHGAIDPTGACARVPCERLTNVWDDIPFQGLAREGHVTFSRNKKPERLLARVLASTTREGDWVLDPFLGSGTTAAVASTMGRRWIGIESGAHGETLAIPRITRVVRGMDQTGLRRGQLARLLPSFGVYRA